VPFEKPTRLIFFFVLATIPLVFGARHPLVHGLYSFFLLITCGTWFILNFGRTKNRLTTFNSLVPIIILFFILLSAVSLPLFLIHLVSPVRAEYLVRAARIAQLHNPVTSLSYYAPTTQFYAVYGLALFFFFQSSASLLRSRTNQRAILWIITMIGVIEAAYGLLQAMNPSLGVLWLPSAVSAAGCARGTIIYRNQFAAFINLCWPMSLVLGISLYQPVFAELDFLNQGKKKQSMTEKFSLLFQKATAPLWASGFMVLALIFSRSRGGIAVMLITGGLFILLLPLSRRIKMFSVGALLLFIFIYGDMIGFQVVIDRFMFFCNGAIERWNLWISSLTMLKDHPLTGIGMGGYEFLSPVYLNNVPDRLWFDRAHNEYVEMAIELGLPLMLLFLTWMFRGLAQYGSRIFKIRKKKKSLGDIRSNEIAAIGAFCGITGLLLHGFVDFVWRLPANVVYAVALLALLNAALGRKKSNEHEISHGLH